MLYFQSLWKYSTHICQWSAVGFVAYMAWASVFAQSPWNGSCQRCNVNVNVSNKSVWQATDSEMCLGYLHVIKNQKKNIQTWTVTLTLRTHKLVLVKKTKIETDLMWFDRVITEHTFGTCLLTLPDAEIQCDCLQLNCPCMHVGASFIYRYKLVTYHRLPPAVTMVAFRK